MFSNYNMGYWPTSTITRSVGQRNTQISVTMLGPPVIWSHKSMLVSLCKFMWTLVCVHITEGKFDSQQFYPLTISSTNCSNFFFSRGRIIYLNIFLTTSPLIFKMFLIITSLRSQGWILMCHPSNNETPLVHLKYSNVSLVPTKFCSKAWALFKSAQKKITIRNLCLSSALECLAFMT